MNLNDYIEANTLRLEASRRGGGIEINLSDYLNLDNARMTAYQNYLGGGLLGSIQNSFNFNRDGLTNAKTKKLDKITDALNRYYYNITNDEASAYDEWAGASYEATQSRPKSAY